MMRREQQSGALLSKL